MAIKFVIATFSTMRFFIIMKLKHYDHDGRARFITFCTHAHLPMLTEDYYKIITQTIAKARDENQFRLISYALMPEHIHLIIIPNIDLEVGRIIGEIKKASSKEIHECLIASNSTLIPKLTVIRNHVERFAFWQRRCFDNNCRTEKSLWEKVNYCHYNPVKRGLVDLPELWKWSSYRWYKGYPDAILKMDIDIES